MDGQEPLEKQPIDEVFVEEKDMVAKSSCVPSCSNDETKENVSFVQVKFE